MATDAQIAALEAALYSGELRITYNGETVEYRSVEEIQRALAAARASSTTGAPRRKVYLTDSPRQKGWA